MDAKSSVPPILNASKYNQDRRYWTGEELRKIPCRIRPAKKHFRLCRRNSWYRVDDSFKNNNGTRITRHAVRMNSVRDGSRLEAKSQTPRKERTPYPFDRLCELEKRVSNLASAMSLCDKTIFANPLQMLSSRGVLDINSYCAVVPEGLIRKCHDSFIG